ncbi:hypothetical protein CW713_07535 [Methanophagales archaeon]|nr:MAG: hypothetical protein CW713_07535 [Methanophagales archaeon]
MLGGMPVEATAPDCIIRNCIFEGITYSYAILLKASNTTFMGNTIEGGTVGPMFEASDAITCRDNIISNTTKTYSSIVSIPKTQTKFVFGFNLGI